MTMDNKTVVDKLQGLLATLHDGETGFKDAAEHATDPALKTLFTERSAQRTALATETESKIASMGEKPRERGSVAASLHRTWLNVRDAVTGRDDYAVLAEVERGEDVAVSNYQDVLNDTTLPAEIRSFVQGQYDQVKATHDQVRDLKHAAEIAKDAGKN